MELSEYRPCITTPIEGENPVGERLIDDSLFDFVEDQMMKVGSLSHASVQWDEVEHSVLKLLKEKSKDIKLLVYLLQCLHHQVTPARFNLSLFIWADFISLFWEESYPAPGPRGALPRRKYFGQIVQRFGIVIDKQDFNRFSGELMSDLESALESLNQAVETKGLVTEDFSELFNTVRSKMRLAEERQRAEQKAQKPKGQSQQETPTTSSPLSVDNSSDKAARQTLLKVSEFLAEQEQGIGLAIRLRRHAVWSGILSEPDHNSDGETMLRPMQQDRIKDYQDLMRSPDLSLWRKIEQSLTMAPYWFEGQMMSYQIAQALDKKDWCRAIREEATYFLERLPKLKTLKFKGGQPFVSEEVNTWLGEQEQATTQASVVGSWQEKRKEAFTLAKEAGIAVALSMINGGLEKAVEPRDKFYWRMMSADLLNEHGFSAMAGEQYQTLYRQAGSASVSEWEPSLMQRLEKYSTSE
ncbi:type VI secretion system protein TssA [Vibrio spartinae]|uniref:Type VI secretion-associated protein, family n=1 Tax=Vibrio spartinae TaxID=1918945 RepID=A0ABX6R3S2_9VIBR|nr:type VI secretion system protein TssA [Vibrio spartinae]QMV16189.1 type VI secretion-associated protein, family [Vibrio spartinae]